MNAKRMKGEDGKAKENACCFDKMSMDEFSEILTFMQEPGDLKSIAIVSKTFLMSAKPYIVDRCKKEKEMEDVFYNWALMSIGVVYELKSSMGFDYVECMQHKYVCESAETCMTLSFRSRKWLQKMRGIRIIRTNQFSSFFDRLLQGANAPWVDYGMVRRSCYDMCSYNFHLWKMNEAHCRDAAHAAKLALEKIGGPVPQLI
jgi:hypothetical protein